MIFVACVVPVFILATTSTVSKGLRKLIGSIGLWGIGKRFNQVLDHLSEFKRLRSLLLKVILVALIVQSLRILTHMVVADALNIELQPFNVFHFFIFIPLLGLIMILPISINGLGVREGTGILLFTQIGLSSEQALLMEFITYFVMVVVSMIGGIFFITRNIRRNVREGMGAQ